jgi:hypothetical protein
MQLPCGQPFPDLSRGSRFGEAVRVERECFNIGSAIGTQGQMYSCPANDHERFCLDSDFCGPDFHGSLQWVCRYGATTEDILRGRRLRSLYCGPYIFLQKVSGSVPEESERLTGGLKTAFCMQRAVH